MGLVFEHGSICWAGSDIWWEHRWAASSPHKASSVKCMHIIVQTCPSISKSSKSKSQSLQKSVMKETSSDFWVFDSIYIWLYLEPNSAEVYRVKKWPWIKIVLEVCHRGEETRRWGWFTPNGSSKTQVPIFVPIWSQCAKQAQSRLSVSKGSCQRILYGSQKDLVCHSPLL